MQLDHRTANTPSIAHTYQEELLNNDMLKTILHLGDNDGKRRKLHVSQQVAALPALRSCGRLPDTRQCKGEHCSQNKCNKPNSAAAEKGSC